MHCLEVIIAKNGRAAGRELAHAVLDNQPIFAADKDGRGWTAPTDPIAMRAFVEAQDEALAAEGEGTLTIPAPYNPDDWEV